MSSPADLLRAKAQAVFETRAQSYGDPRGGFGLEDGELLAQIPAGAGTLIVVARPRRERAITIRVWRVGAGPRAIPCTGVIRVVDQILPAFAASIATALDAVAAADEERRRQPRQPAVRPAPTQPPAGDPVDNDPLPAWAQNTPEAP